jgi:hypothetical protein
VNRENKRFEKKRQNDSLILFFNFIFMAGIDQQKPLNPQELVDAMNRAARETRE